MDNMVIIEATLLIISLFIMFNIGYSTLRLGISPMPSNPKVRTTMIELWKSHRQAHYPLQTPLKIADLGAGFGGLARQIAKENPDIQMTAYERGLVPWTWLHLQQGLTPLPNLTIKKINFLHEHLHEHDYLFCYLCPSVMQALSDRLIFENQPFHLISAAFSLPQFTAISTQKSKDWQSTSVYLYEKPNLVVKAVQAKGYLF